MQSPSIQWGLGGSVKKARNVAKWVSSIKKPRRIGWLENGFFSTLGTRNGEFFIEVQRKDVCQEERIHSHSVSSKKATTHKGMEQELGRMRSGTWADN